MSQNDNPYSFKLFEFQLLEPSKDDPVPEARSGHRMVCNSKSLYLYGGYNPTAPNNGYQELWEYNFSLKKWRKFDIQDNFPEEVISCALLRRQDKLVIYGGTAVPFAFKCSNKLYTIKLSDDCVRISSLLIHGKKPKRQYGQAIVMQKNMLYVIGGTDGFSYNCDIHRVNLNKNPRVWRSLYLQKKSTEENGGYEPSGRYRHEIAFNGKNIYIIGGGTAIKSYSLIDIPVFNIKTKKWQKMASKGDPCATPSYPDARRCHGVVQVKTANDIHVFVLGGYQNNEEAFNDLWRLELSTLQWTLITKNMLPKAPYFHSVALTREGKLYVFGGMEGGRVLKRNNKLFSAWIRIPPLAEIAWEALLHYFPNVLLANKFNHLQIPNHFLSRCE